MKKDIIIWVPFWKFNLMKEWRFRGVPEDTTLFGCNVIDSCKECALFLIRPFIQSTKYKATSPLTEYEVYPTRKSRIPIHDLIAMR